MTSSAHLTLASEIAALSPEQATLPQRRHVIRQARVLGRCDLLPSWIHNPPPSPTDDLSPDAICASVNNILSAKIAAHAPTRATLTLLQLVYLRGLRTAPPLTTTPLTPQQHAQARVNTFLAFLDGDPTASRQDSDLVAPISRAAVR